jgi:hypothetical protein
MTKYKNLNTYEKFKLLGLIIKAVFGTIGGAVILEQNHPYLALLILAIGAGANEWVSFLKDREMTNITNKIEHETTFI